MQQKSPSTLEQLLRRPDVWQGHSHAFLPQTSIKSGHKVLDKALQHQGWPTHSMIEICQLFHSCEWWLFHPAIQSLNTQEQQRYIALINPPATPYIDGLERLGITTNQLIVVQTQTPAEFITSVTELNQCPVCCVVMAWQPKQTLTYTQLRKLQLSASQRDGLSIIFRHARAKQQSSPASLRMLVTPNSSSINIHIFKQRGKLQHTTIDIDPPNIWKGLAPHRLLDVDHEQALAQYPEAARHTSAKISLFPTHDPLAFKRRSKRDYR